MPIDTDEKLAATFRAARGKVLAYRHDIKKYTIRPDVADLDIIDCPYLDTGIDAPWAVGDDVLIQRIPNQGWIVLGRIPVARNVGARTSQQLPEETPQETGEVSYQDPANDEAIFHARPGDAITVRKQSKFVVSRVGVIAAKVKDTCSMVLSAGLSVIKITAFDWVLSLPRLTVRMFLDRNTEQPKLKAQFKPQNTANIMRLLMGGGAADEADGLDLSMGQSSRLLFQLLPASQRVVYTQNEEQLRIESNIGQFLLQFGDGVWRWTDLGLQVTKGNTTILVDSTSLVISTETATLTAESLTTSVNGVTTLNSNDVQVVTQILVMQNFHWLTVVQRLNSLLLVFASHTHNAGPIQTSQPIGSPVNEKGTPIGTPIAAGEPPLSV